MEKKKKLSVKLDDEIYKTMAKLCIDLGIKHQQFIEYAVKHCLEKKIYPPED